MSKAISDKLTAHTEALIENFREAEKGIAEAKKTIGSLEKKKSDISAVLKKKMDAGFDGKAEYHKLQKRHYEIMVEVSRARQAQGIFERTMDEAMTALGFDPRIVEAKK